VRNRTAVPLGIAAAAAAGLGYSAIVERNLFRLRRAEAPVLPPGARPIRVLHISDAHLTPGRKLLTSWLRSLDMYDPDLVVNTGDSLAHPDAVGPFLDALGPLLDRPGLFVYGSNDLYSPRPKNPARYLWRTTTRDYKSRTVPDLPWGELGAGMTDAGWLDLNNQRGRLKVGELDIEVAGVHDPHIKRDRYDEIAAPGDPAADLRIGLTHSPEPRVLDRFTADGFDMLFAGHTHGGQLCVPFYGALVTNCGIDRARVKGLNRYGPAWLNVSAGLGTSPYAPVRFSCPPEATLLTLTPRDPAPAS
jgi:predicted MPP superfamily phosphohydrolase